MDVQTNGCQL
ncbi:unnamed protein product, partial [Didymodactylos carnosus]